MPSTIQTPEDWPMVLYHGDTWPPYSISIIDEAGTALTGFSVKMQVKRSPDDTVAVKTLTQSGGFSIAGNTLTFRDVVDLPPGDYFYDIQITLSNGNVHTQYSGSIQVDKDVTT